MGTVEIGKGCETAAIRMHNVCTRTRTYFPSEIRQVSLGNNTISKYAHDENAVGADLRTTVPTARLTVSQCAWREVTTSSAQFFLCLAPGCLGAW